MVDKIRSRKEDQAAKPGIATVHGQCMSVAISWVNKKQLAKCVYMVGFPISSHICILVLLFANAAAIKIVTKHTKHMRC